MNGDNVLGDDICLLQKTSSSILASQKTVLGNNNNNSNMYVGVQSTGKQVHWKVVLQNHIRL